MKNPITRCNGWTIVRRDAFIAALAAGWTVTRAAARVSLSASSAYRLYRRDACFAARWDQVAADRRAVMHAAPLPRRDTGSLVQLTRWLTPSKRAGFDRVAGGPAADIDAILMTFMNLHADRDDAAHGST